MAGERLYYTDSFLRRFAAHVTAVREAPSGSANEWQLALDRTAFYPTSGGQPFDTGRLRVLDGNQASAEVTVEAVAEDDNGEIWHAVRQPIAPGTPVEGEIDWDRRLDHMQQHSGQHLLSAVLWSHLQAQTVSFHLGETISNVDLACALPREEALEQVELSVNRIIVEDRTVTARVAVRAEAEALLAAGRLRKLPERAGALRLIEIADCDLNACGGTHVSSTGQIGGLWLRGLEKGGRGARVHFVCGLRAVGAGRSDVAALRRASAALSVGTSEIPAAIERLQTEAKAAVKDRQRLREALAEAEGARLAAGAEVRGGVRIVETAGVDADAEYARLLASRTAGAAPATVAIVSSGRDKSVRVVLARSRDLGFDCGAILKALLSERGLRGGGSAELAQTEVAAEDAAQLRAELAARVRAMIESS